MQLPIEFVIAAVAGIVGAAIALTIGMLYAMWREYLDTTTTERST